jgi:hypothetical protein
VGKFRFSITIRIVPAQFAYRLHRFSRISESAGECCLCTAPKSSFTYFKYRWITGKLPCPINLLSDAHFTASTYLPDCLPAALVEYQG